MSLAKKNIVAEIAESVSVPDIVLQVNEMVDDDGYTIEDITRLLNQDNFLCSRLLEIANSTMYESDHEITSINQVIVYLGIMQIRELVILLSVIRMFAGLDKSTFPVKDFWHHSLYCGLLARSFASVTRKVKPDTMLTAGLLHNIGQRILMDQIPEEEESIVLQTSLHGEHAGFDDAENDLIAVKHAETGSRFARQWQLLPMLIECIACHHAPEKAILFPEAVAHICIARSIASLPDAELPDHQDLAKIDSEILERAGLNISNIEECVIKARKQLVETRILLFGY